MHKLTLNTSTFDNKEGDTVLDTLLSNGIDIPYACKAGVCQSCLIRSPDQMPPVDAQKGLKKTQQANHFFLACQCHPTKDMTLELDPNEQPFIASEVMRVSLLNNDILELILKHPEGFNFQPGQFINLRNSKGIVRSYSIANAKNTDNTLELHIRKLANGQFSEWVHQQLKVGDAIDFQGPFGDCFYVQDNPLQPLVLIGTGTGLAPLIGIVSEALSKGHQGPIHLYHGSSETDGLYLMDTLKDLAVNQLNFHYTPCLSGSSEHPECINGRVHDIALQSFADLAGHKVYLCGHPEMVKAAQRKAYLAGASLQDIFADAFTVNTPDKA